MGGTEILDKSSFYLLTLTSEWITEKYIVDFRPDFATGAPGAPESMSGNIDASMTYTYTRLGDMTLSAALATQNASFGNITSGCSSLATADCLEYKLDLA